MRIAVLGATGAVGRHLVQQALERGHAVVALARSPRDLPASVTTVVADVHNPAAVLTGLTGVDAVVSGLGIAKGDPAGALLAGAQALAQAHERDPALRVVWLGAFGTGPSAKAAGALVRGMLGLGMRSELPDKTGADATVLSFGGTVFHSGPMNDGPVSPTRRVVGVEGAPRRLMPRFVSRVTVAAAMLDEAELPKYAGQIAVPLP